METRVMKWGNSQGIRLPRTLLEEVNLKSGDRVEVTVKDHTLVISPPKARYSLDRLVRDIKPSNLHGEVGTGRARGREEW